MRRVIGFKAHDSVSFAQAQLCGNHLIGQVCQRYGVSRLLSHWYRRFRYRREFCSSKNRSLPS
ncbi:hypothetical protein MICAI_2450002 [Microcystis sp. T1-4]|nr:hypothetical protein MICAI_2450002 [Microcystis sp. T1-4]